MKKMAAHLALLFFICACSAANCVAGEPEQSLYFTSSDGVRLHYIAEGTGETLLFVPGWLMPAEIWRPQIDYFARTFQVIAFDPRSQGRSEIAASGNNIQRRAQDLHELVEHLKTPRVVLVGWSLGVLESLLYVSTHGDGRIAALVLVDNSVGEAPGQSGDAEIRYQGPRNRKREMATFVGSMFKSAQTPEYLEWLTDETLRAPPETGQSLLAIPYPRTFWRSAVYQTRKPLLYAVTGSLKGQAETLKRKRKDTSIAVFAGAGHALFVDDPARFNASVAAFLATPFAE
jgi:non-heme chloroperoxidase